MSSPKFLLILYGFCTFSLVINLIILFTVKDRNLEIIKLTTTDMNSLLVIQIVFCPFFFCFSSDINSLLGGIRTQIQFPESFGNWNHKKGIEISCFQLVDLTYATSASFHIKGTDSYSTF